MAVVVLHPEALPNRLWKILLPLGCLLFISCASLDKSDYPDQSIPGLVEQILDPSVYQPDMATHRLGKQQQVNRVIASRSSPPIDQTILGALIFLSDTQIKDREGLQSSLYDYCHADKETCNGVILVNRLGGKEYKQQTPNFKGFKIRNVLGEWATTIHFLPNRFGDKEGEAKVAIQDSSVFSTAGILYPLYFIDERMLPPEARFITDIRSLAAGGIARYKRGDAYNFWIESPGETSSHPKSAPFNIPVEVSQKMGFLLTGAFSGFWERYTEGMDIGGEAWVGRLLDKNENPYGFDAAFNIPNDADDTSTVVATQKYHSKFHPDDDIEPDLSALRVVTRFLDRDRNKMDMRDQWRGEQETGAFLTWLKDEDLETFSSPERGIMTHGVNNVDCVVNANALFSFALNEVQTWKGFDDAKRLLIRTINERLWTREKCGLYYPQLMMFPYTITRAFRESGLHDDPMLASAMGVLLQDLLAMQSDNGSFPGGKDKTSHLPTSLAVSSLINIGAETAQRLNLMDPYQKSIAKGIAFLVEERMPHHVMFADTFSMNSSELDTRYGYKWHSGLFFSTSFWDLAHWRSEAYTAAIVVEALVKFALAYDMDRSTLLQGRTVLVSSYDDSIRQDHEDSKFSFEVGW